MFKRLAVRVLHELSVCLGVVSDAKMAALAPRVSLGHCPFAPEALLLTSVGLPGQA